MLWLGLNWPSCCLFSIHPNCSFFLFLAQFWIVQVSYLSFPFIFIIGLLPICLCFIFFSRYFHVCNIHSQLILVYLQIVFITLCIAVRNLRRSFPGMIWKRPLYTEGRESLRKETAPSRLVCGSFIEQRNLLMRLALGDHKTRSFAHQPAKS